MALTPRKPRRSSTGSGIPFRCPQAEACNTPCFTTFVLLVDLLNVPSLLFNGTFQPKAPLLRCGMTAGAIRARAGVVIPRWVGDQGAAFDPVHVVGRRSDKVRFIDDALHMAKIGAQMEH